MLKTFILTEKPSVAMDFARGLGIRGKKDGYLENDRYIITWAVGHLVFLIDTLKKFSTAGTLASPGKTASWEMELARIAAGKGSVEVFLEGIENFVRDTVREFLESETEKVQREAVGRCPLCGRDVVEGYKTYACSAKRKADGGCRFVIWKKIRVQDAKRRKIQGQTQT